MYISQEGLVELKRELEERTRQTRRMIAETLCAAKELGDLSENFEYQDAKEQQALNEARIFQLEDMIREAVIVTQTIGNDKIILGSTFTALVAEQEKTYQMVGSTEADPLSGKISNESPLGRTLIGHQAGDVVLIEAPNGQIEYKIISIE